MGVVVACVVDVCWCSLFVDVVVVSVFRSLRLSCLLFVFGVVVRVRCCCSCVVLCLYFCCGLCSLLLFVFVVVCVLLLFALVGFLVCV